MVTVVERGNRMRVGLAALKSPSVPIAHSVHLEKEGDSKLHIYQPLPPLIYLDLLQQPGKGGEGETGNAAEGPGEQTR